ncbi:hypothetical protein [Paenarthrobacter sp. YJN-5]|uniref:hypothetical protein n=1 Tax=Paenarthrobacter sp. YJN-5 TaxID=2735316 RepID=UPI001878E0D8|nr:hypothetical protein [Paenarthrobacter sp. YJN-5]QOT16481.1 hypothetical protein HMI59_07600 [Paenarthrobacter sp. YJN-5]
MGSRVLFTDLELYLTGRIRQELAAIAAPITQNVFVSNQFPSPARPKAVVVRDDSGPQTSIITKEPSIGITVLAGDDPTQGQQATELANLVFMIVGDCAGPEPGNPVAKVVNATGPFKVTEESGQPRRYMTFELAVVGIPFT